MLLVTHSWAVEMWQKYSYYIVYCDALSIQLLCVSNGPVIRCWLPKISLKSKTYMWADQEKSWDTTECYAHNWWINL